MALIYHKAVLGSAKKGHPCGRAAGVAGAGWQVAALTGHFDQQTPGHTPYPSPAHPVQCYHIHTDIVCYSGALQHPRGRFNSVVSCALVLSRPAAPGQVAKIRSAYSHMIYNTHRMALGRPVRPVCGLPARGQGPRRVVRSAARREVRSGGDGSVNVELWRCSSSAHAWARRRGCAPKAKSSTMVAARTRGRV